MGRPSRGLVLVVLGALAGLALVVVLVLRDGPGRSTSGRVVEVSEGRLCVAGGAGGEGDNDSGAGGDNAAECARVDRPTLIAGVLVGDCVEMRRSSDGILERVEAAVDC